MRYLALLAALPLVGCATTECAPFVAIDAPAYVAMPLRSALESDPPIMGVKCKECPCITHK